jgi:cytochrome b561
MNSTSTPHSRITRLFHTAIALLVIVQVLTSQFMALPKPRAEENLIFEIHEYSGITAFFLIFLFWFFTLRRNKGTEIGLLFPWFSRKRLAELGHSTKIHLKAFSHWKLPPYDPDAALPSAIHGLGIMLIATMATTGVIMFIAFLTGNGKASWAGAANEVHEIFSNLVWAFLIGHAGIALLNHFAGKQSLADMFSLKKND